MDGRIRLKSGFRRVFSPTFLAATFSLRHINHALAWDFRYSILSVARPPHSIFEVNGDLDLLQTFTCLIFTSAAGLIFIQISPAVFCLLANTEGFSPRLSFTFITADWAQLLLLYVLNNALNNAAQSRWCD